MSTLIVEESVFFMQTLRFGVKLGFVYDLLRIFRNVVGHSRFATALEDLLFWTVITMQMFHLLEKYNYGGLRFYVIVGAGLGTIIYLKTLSPIFVKSASSFLNRIKFFLLRIKNHIWKKVEGKTSFVTGKVNARKEFLRQQKERFLKNMKKKLTKNWKMVKMIIRKN